MNDTYTRQLQTVNEVLLGACEIALKKLENMTTENFSQGGDKAIRDMLRVAIATAREDT